MIVMLAIYTIGVICSLQDLFFVKLPSHSLKFSCGYAHAYVITDDMENGTWIFVFFCSMLNYHLV